MAVIITMMFLSLSIAPMASAKSNTYKLRTTVYKVEKTLVTFKDKNGNLWQAYITDKKWKKGQKAKLTMNTQNTKSIYDDCITKIKKIKK